MGFTTRGQNGFSECVRLHLSARSLPGQDASGKIDRCRRQLPGFQFDLQTFQRQSDDVGK
jgi:hypothetical protein